MNKSLFYPFSGKPGAHLPADTGEMEWLAFGNPNQEPRIGWARQLAPPRVRSTFPFRHDIHLHRPNTHSICLHDILFKYNMHPAKQLTNADLYLFLSLNLSS